MDGWTDELGGRNNGWTDELEGRKDGWTDELDEGKMVIHGQTGFCQSKGSENSENFERVS